MRNMQKTVLLVLVLCLALCMMLFAVACNNTPSDGGTPGGDISGDGSGDGNTDTNPPEGGDTQTPDTKITYTVIIKDQNGNAVEGVEAQICVDGVCKKPNVTDAEGVVTFKIDNPGESKLELQINGDNSVAGYEYPTEKIAIEAGQTTIEVTINALTTYTVSASDLFGNNCADMVVNLFTLDGDTPVESKVTDKTGRVVFRVQPGTYYVTISHVSGNPAFVITNADEEGSNVKTFAKNETTFNASIVISTAPIDYSVTVWDAAGKAMTGVEVTLYDEQGLVAADAVLTDEDGTAVFSVPNGNYYAYARVSEDKFAPVLAFVENDVVSGEISVSNTAQGSTKETAIPVFGMPTFAPKAGENTWYYLINGYKKQLEIDSETAKVIYNGTTYTADDGVVRVTFSEKSGEAAYFQLSTTKTSGTDDMSASITTPGSFDSPIVLDSAKINGMKLPVTLGQYEVVYYTFLATMDGTVTLSCSNANADVYVNGRSGKAPVSKGDTVTISIGTMDGSPAKLEVTMAYATVRVDYTVHVALGSVTAAGVKVTLYRFDGNSYAEIASGTTDAEGACVFADLIEAANYYVKTEYAAYETAEQYIKVDDTYFSVYMSHVADGSADYPYEVGMDMTGLPVTTTVTVPAGGSVWYSMTIPANYTLIVPNQNVSVKIYRDTNGNWIPDAQDTPVEGIWDAAVGAVVYEFGSTNVQRERCLIVFSSESAVTFELRFDGSAASSEGGSLENAIEVSQSGTLTANVKGGKHVYFVYFGEVSGKVKISCSDKTAVLTIWTRSMGGDSGEVVPGGSYEADYGMYNWLYFSVSNSSGEDVTYTVTFEFDE